MKVLWQQISSPTITEILCSSKFDGVAFDLEHGCFSNESLYCSIQICGTMGKKSLIRVTDLDKPVIRMALDAGCSGVIMSTIESQPQAKQFYDYCVYPPEGKRGQGLVRENLWGEKDFDFRKVILIAQIETVEGVGNLESIASIDFDHFLIGPYDLSASLGDVGNFNSEKYIECINIIEGIVGDRMGYHIVKDIQSQFENLRHCGFLAFSIDTLMLIDGVKELEETCIQ